MGKRLVAGNWKMHMTPREAAALARRLTEQMGACACDVAFCVPAIDLPAVAEVLAGTPVALGAQNMYFEDKGAFTGEISPAMLTEVGARYVILGHSERRQLFGETDGAVNQKVKKALEVGLVPILCCGETLEQREAGVTPEWVRMQLKLGLWGLTAEEAARVVVAYEPIWAIGTGRTATPEQAQEVCGEIRQLLKELFGADTAQSIRVLYGGSVNAGNCHTLFAMPDIDGGLIGGASLKDEFLELLKP